MDNFRAFQNWRQPQTPQNALMQGLEVQRAQQGNALQQYQLQALMQRAQQEQAAQAKQQQFVQGLPSPQMMASQNALAGGGGPTVGNAQRMQPVDPRLQMQHSAMQAGMLSLEPGGPRMTCRQALAYSLWTRHSVRAAAEAELGEPIARIDHYGTFACRNIAGSGARSQQPQVTGQPATQH